MSETFPQKHYIIIHVDKRFAVNEVPTKGIFLLYIHCFWLVY